MLPVWLPCETKLPVVPFWSCHLLCRSLQWFTLSATWNTNSFPHILGPVIQVRQSPNKLSISCYRFFGQMFPHSGMFCLLFSICFSYKYLYCSSNLTQIAACGFSLISWKSAQMSHLAATPPTSYPHSLLYHHTLFIHVLSIGLPGSRDFVNVVHCCILTN